MKNIRSKRCLFRAHFESIDEQKNVIILRYLPLSKHDELIVSKSDFLYVKGKFKNLLFKFNIIFHDQQRRLLLLNIPNNIQIEECRHERRFSFASESNFLVEVFNANRGDGVAHFVSGKLLDLSSKGMGVLIPRHHICNWSVGDHLCLSRVNGIKIGAKFIGTIEYMAERDTKPGPKDYRIGLQFEHELPWNPLMASMGGVVA